MYARGRGGARQVAATPLHGDRARRGIRESEEPVEGLERRACATAKAVERTVFDSEGSVGVGGCVANFVGVRIETDHDGHAKIGEEGGVEDGAEVAAAGYVGVVAPLGRRYDVVVRGPEEEELAGDEGDYATVGGAANKKYLRIVDKPKSDIVDSMHKRLHTWSSE